MIQKSIERLEFLGRLSSITEELESIAKESSRHDTKTAKRPSFNESKILSLADLSSAPVFYQGCRRIVLSALLAGRATIDAYVAGKSIGLLYKFKGEKSLESACKDLGIHFNSCMEKEDREEISIQLEKGFTASQVKFSAHPVCFFEAGLLSGLLEKLKKRRFDLQESACVATGAKGCRFMSRKINLDDKNILSNVKGSLPLLPLEQYSDENIRLLTSLASHALTAIENTLLFEKTKRQSVVDVLTGVYNHRYFQQTMRVEFKRSQRHAQPLSLIMIDVDHFKEINDEHGHLKGDRALKALARIFVSCVREIDVVARYGGDEFMIVLPQTNLSGASIVASRIQRNLSNIQITRAGKKTIPLTVSIGVVEKSKGNAEPNQLIEAVDKALLKAKKKRGGSIIVLDDGQPKTVNPRAPLNILSHRSR